MSGPSVIRCNECDRPWGTRDGSADDLRRWFAEWWQERWADEGGDEANRPPVPLLPEPTTTTIVFVSEKNATWLSERFGLDMILADCWQEVAETDAPAWWTNPRAKTALRWDCCELPYPDSEPLYAGVSFCADTPTKGDTP